MVYYFIPRPLIMIGSLRRVRERGRKPEDSRTTREKLGREGGRSTCSCTGVSAEDTPESPPQPESPPSRPESPPDDHWNLRPRLRPPPKSSLEVHPESRAESTPESPPRTGVSGLSDGPACWSWASAHVSFQTLYLVPRIPLARGWPIYMPPPPYVNPRMDMMMR